MKLTPLHILLNLSLIVFCLAISSCFKTEEIPSKRELLKTGKWQLTEYINHPGGVISASIDMYASLPACEKDNYYIFRSNDIAELNEGSTKCIATAPQVSSSNWQYIDDGTLIFEGQVWQASITETKLGMTTVKYIGGKGDHKTFVKF
jgi:hypothetical protein